ncbi:MAG: transcriptional regulator [Dehalococcoidia bacterium]|nr:transcriptional regulator [Dehalococcoidia bacterium]
MPLLLCVSWQALQSGDSFDNVDDFVVVPCSAAELAKRITRLTMDSRLAATQETQRITVGDIAINTDTYEVTVSGMAIPLAWTEFQLLQFLMLNVGRVFHREDLLLHVWGADYIGGLRTVDVHIRRLRGKLGQSGERWLRTVRKVGYGLDRRPTLG